MTNLAIATIAQGFFSDSFGLRVSLKNVSRNRKPPTALFHSRNFLLACDDTRASFSKLRACWWLGKTAMRKENCSGKAREHPQNSVYLFPIFPHWHHHLENENEKHSIGNFPFIFNEKFSLSYTSPTDVVYATCNIQVQSRLQTQANAAIMRCACNTRHRQLKGKLQYIGEDIFHLFLDEF